MEFLSVFASVDKDQDLVIHEADLDNYAAEMKYEKAFTQKWLRLFDKNQDGKITFTEFCETLGLNEKVYEEKLREVRKNLLLRQQQPQTAATDSDRANRRVSRLPRQQPTATAQKLSQQEVKENIEPQQAARSRTAPPQKSIVEDVEEDVIKPKATQQARSGISSGDANKSSPEEVVIVLNDDDPRSIEVEFSDMEPAELEKLKALLAKLASELAKSDEDAKSSSEFDRKMMRELDKQMGGGAWQCQSNPELSHKEVNYQEGSMAVLVAKPQKRVMLWRPQKAGGMCCCS